MKSTRNLASKRRKSTRSSLDQILMKLRTKIKNMDLKIESLQKDTNRLLHEREELLNHIARLDQRIQDSRSLHDSLEKELEILVSKRRLTGMVPFGGPQSFLLNPEVSDETSFINQQLEINPSPKLTQHFEQLQLSPCLQHQLGQYQSQQITLQQQD